MVNSMPSFTPSSSVHSTSSGFMMSMSWPAWIWPARTSPGPVAVSTIRFGPSPCMRSASCLMFSTMSVTSSRTPGIELNSCSTPSICTAVTAAPCSDDSRMRRMALPSVMPKPRSSGSATMVATFDGSAPGSTSSLSGLISDCQLRWMTKVCLMYPIPVVPGRGPEDGRRTGRNVKSARLGSNGPWSDPPALARAAAVVRDRRHVADGGDREADRLERPQRALAPRPRAADLDLERFHAVLARLLAGVLGGHLGGVRRRFAAALEALAAGRRPGNGVTLRVGDGDHRVVESRGDMGDAGRDVLALLSAGARGGGG